MVVHVLNRKIITVQSDWGEGEYERLNSFSAKLAYLTISHAPTFTGKMVLLSGSIDI
jgi:hypothetical protein